MFRSFKGSDGLIRPLIGSISMLINPTSTLKVSIHFPRRKLSTCLNRNITLPSTEKGLNYLSLHLSKSIISKYTARI